MRGLVLGAYCEASADVHDLISLAADRLAQMQWRLAGARSQSEMRSFLVGRSRSRVGCAAWLATARYRIGRLQYIGVPREAVVARIQQAQFRAQETAQGRAQRLYEPLPSHADFFGYQALGSAQRVAAVGA